MNINLMTWFSERQMEYLPIHFQKASTLVDDEKLYWILENLSGRFYLGHDSNYSSLFDYLEGDTIYFEDPKELVLYELTWS